MRRTGSARVGRYTAGARVYDLLSLEWPVYRAGRVAGVRALDLRPGEAVVDVGCGTGLSLPLLAGRVGAAGSVVGVDASPQMLARAERRVDRQGLSAVRLVRAAAADADRWRMPERPFDAALICYSLSIVADWQLVWRNVLAAVRPGGRVALVDLDLPRGRWRWLGPAAALLCWSGGVHRSRRTWEAVARDLREVQEWRLRAGHIRVVCGRT